MGITYNLSSNIEFLLSFRNIKQDDLGNMIGTKGKNVSNWINNTAKPPIDKLFAISKEFNISLDTLVFGSKNDIEREVLGYNIELKNFKTEESGNNYKFLNKLIRLDEDLIHKEESLTHLVRWLTQNHEKLLNDTIYQLFIGSIITEYKTQEIKREERSNVSGNKEGNLTSK